MQRLPVELSIYQTGDGRRPFAEWFQRLVDRSVQARVMQRLDRLQSGNPEAKRTQAADIERARKWLDEARRRTSQ